MSYTAFTFIIFMLVTMLLYFCLLYTSDAADE